ncbi:hypothetical protein ACH5RR_011500 [Cinchona calisaya]|uniref:RING-type domain-containing protein n=1 Tax=Cinchona calisaya TaxID=153742 RepID=A0ABD3A518_9GENT
MSFAYRIPTSPDHELPLMSKNYAILITTTRDDEHDEWSTVLAFASRVVIYVAIIALLVMIVALIVKLLGNLVGDDTGNQLSGAQAATETNRLLAKEVVQFTYGTCEEDVESGKCSNIPSEDLYDGKICVICYDQQRNCFFIPCGHCATCYICAQRITYEENKNCPVCRRYIHKKEMGISGGCLDKKPRALVLSRNEIRSLVLR